MTTTNKGMQFPANGAAINTWDTASPGGVNTNFTIVDTALGGSTGLNVTGASGTIVLSLAQYTPPNLEINGTLTAAVAYQIPLGVGGTWSISNQSSGAFAITFGMTGSNSLTIPQGQRVMIISDGAGVYTEFSTVPNPGSAGQVVYCTSSGYVSANGNFTFDGTNITCAGNVVSGQTVSAAQLSISTSVSGAGFTTYMASPPPIGSTTPNKGSFTQAYTPLVALGNSSAAFSVNAAASNVFSVTMTAASTMSITGAVAGQTVNVRIQQDGTGGRVMTWPGNFKWPGGTAGVLSTGASQIDLLVATYDGTYWLATLAKSFA